MCFARQDIHIHRIDAAMHLFSIDMVSLTGNFNFVDPYVKHNLTNLLNFE
jgi:hypothetical protein